MTTDVHPVAAATGAHAFFTAADGSRGVARNHVHWPSAYMAAFREADLSVDRLEEILVDEAFIAEIKMPDVREADEEARAWLAPRDRVGGAEGSLTTG